MLAEAYTAGSVGEWAIYGSNLASAHAHNVKLYFNGVPLSVRGVSHSELRVVIPPGTGGGKPVFISVEGRNSSTVLNVDYQQPVISDYQLAVSVAMHTCVSATAVLVRGASSTHSHQCESAGISVTNAVGMKRSIIVLCFRT